MLTFLIYYLVQGIEVYSSESQEDLVDKDPPGERPSGTLADIKL